MGFSRPEADIPHSHMNALARYALTTGTVLVGLFPCHVFAQQNIGDAELIGAWQYGLVGEARRIPVGLAFQKGLTATVVTFSPDHTLRVEIPCRNEQFIRQNGEVVFDGTWSLAGGTLLMEWTFRGQRIPTKPATVGFEGGDLILTEAAGSKHLSRFQGDTQASCVYE